MSDAVHIDEKGVARCWWAMSTPAYQAYHDTEWGRPTSDDRWLFEKICLEGFQSGLSWRTILEKRENFRAAFANFDMEKVAAFGDADVTRLLGDTGIVRHRGKILSAINNAQRAVELCETHGSLAAFVWQFEPAPLPGEGPGSKAEHIALQPAPEARAMAKDLKKKGWRFVGPTTAYAFMQAAGLVNDHAKGCSARAACLAERERFRPPEPPLTRC